MQDLDGNCERLNPMMLNSVVTLDPVVSYGLTFQNRLSSNMYQHFEFRPPRFSFKRDFLLSWLNSYLKMTENMHKFPIFN